MPKLDMPRKAMIMAAGFGTRLRPLTDNMPKPLVKILGKPLIDYTLDFLAEAGVTEAIVNSHYLAELLEEHVNARTSPPKIIISREDVVLETGGGIKNALHLLGNEPFFVINSDIIYVNGKTHALRHLWQYWYDTNMDALLLLHKLGDAIGYSEKGDFFLEKNGKLRRRIENETAPFVFTGIQIIHPRLFVNSPNGKFSLNVLYNKNLNRIGATVGDGNWLHIGSPEELKEAENWFSKETSNYSKEQQKNDSIC